VTGHSICRACALSQTLITAHSSFKQDPSSNNQTWKRRGHLLLHTDGSLCPYPSNDILKRNGHKIKIKQIYQSLAVLHLTIQYSNFYNWKQLLLFYFLFFYKSTDRKSSTTTFFQIFSFLFVLVCCISLVYVEKS